MERERPVVERCRSCDAEVVWIRKPSSSSRMIVDATPEAIRRRRDDIPFENGIDGLSSHLVTCPDWERWSKREREARRR